ncbi:hypothetical protein ILUMI_01050 [Ignelater luminosus]|uniref:CRAL-TRIO domain-containing protein n=1 Tax=Ignelater luminosus TaxID=2038154 RepID=A0A8K0GPL5_IGNLU|nr:hypothetical protein ILUMI_01050 [Ignelater luminosus]
MKEHLKKKIEATEINVLRRAGRTSKLEKIRDDIIKEQLGIKETIIDCIEKKPLVWYRHVQRDGRKEWIHGIRKYMSERNLTAENCINSKTWQLRIGERHTIGPAGSRLIFIRAGNADPKRASATTFAKCIFMILDILCKEDPNSTIAGISLITDFQDMSYGYITQMTPSFLKKMATSLLAAYPVRIKSVYFINAPLAFIAVYHVMKLLLSEKLKQRIHFYNKLDYCYNDIPRLVLPKEYGGEQASCDEISDELKLKLESYRNWLLDDEQFRSNDTKKYKTSKNRKH